MEGMCPRIPGDQAERLSHQADSGTGLTDFQLWKAPGWVEDCPGRDTTEAATTQHITTASLLRSNVTSDTIFRFGLCDFRRCLVPLGPFAFRRRYVFKEVVWGKVVPRLR